MREFYHKSGLAKAPSREHIVYHKQLLVVEPTPWRRYAVRWLYQRDSDAGVPGDPSRRVRDRRVLREEGVRWRGVRIRLGLHPLRARRDQLSDLSPRLDRVPLRPHDFRGTRPPGVHHDLRRRREVRPGTPVSRSVSRGLRTGAVALVVAVSGACHRAPPTRPRARPGPATARLRPSPPHPPAPPPAARVSHGPTPPTRPLPARGGRTAPPRGCPPGGTGCISPTREPEETQARGKTRPR